ncbi:hypothetical protein, partial [Natronorubrum halalkaliphilum]|uniref:hypothetical protein n=1 Tax=Natronorubrum halalkaliphilum TaxID=2691917 RepID=UPI001A9B82E3
HRDVDRPLTLDGIVLARDAFDEVCGKEEVNRRRMSVGESSGITTSLYAVSEDNFIMTLASVGFAP